MGQDFFSPWMSGINSDNAKKANEQALAAQVNAGNNAQSLQEQMFAYQKSLQDPFFKGSLPAYYQMLDAITGQRQTYDDPNFSLATADELNRANMDAVRTRDPNMRAMSDEIIQQLIDNGYAPREYQLGKNYYKNADGTFTADKPAQITTTAYAPTDTPAYQWQKQQLDKNMNRQLATTGRTNSSYGMGQMANAYQQLGAQEYDKQLGRLADLTNVARGGASSLANAATGYTNASNSNMINNGNNLANASLANGMLNQNSLYNMQNNIGSAINTGIKAYNAFGNQNNNNAYGQLYSDSGGNINNVDFGSDWGNWSDGTQA